MSRIPLTALAPLALLAVLPLSLPAQKAEMAQKSADQKMEEALGAAPAGVAENATIMDWPSEEGGEFTVLREGSNGWTCLPDPPGENFEPMCNDGTWMSWVEAFMAGEEPRVETLGISYMLNSTGETSNTDPGATGKTADNEWHEVGPHMMVLVPDPAMLEIYPDDPSSSLPYVMWKGTPYVHLMIPMEAGMASAPR